MIEWQDQSQLAVLLREADLSSALYQPLLEIQSLTVGLEALDPDFSVTLLHLGEVVREGRSLFSRQVLLNLKGVAVIAAESLCDQHSDFWHAYLNCGTQSLGRRLFNGENEIDRSPFSYALMNVKDLPVFAQIGQYADKVIARRSIFQMQDQQLSLIEYYLPTLNQFKR